MKYKVGDKVKVRSWEDMEKQYGLDYDGDINTSFCFVKSMREYCGKILTVKYAYSDHYNMADSGWNWTDDMLEPTCKQKIVITTDGVETLARLYEGDKVVKKATAKCSPDDTFDFIVGAKLVFERLTNEEKKPSTFREKLVKEHPEKVNRHYGGGCNGCPKDYGYESEHYCKTRTANCTKCWDREIPEDKAKKKEEDPPKYYNGKVVCVECGFEYSFPLLDITIGKVYTVTDGILVADNNYKSCKYKTLRELCVGLGYKFIPFVE